jgi:hypothetical protein
MTKLYIYSQFRLTIILGILIYPYKHLGHFDPRFNINNRRNKMSKNDSVAHTIGNGTKVTTYASKKTDHLPTQFRSVGGIRVGDHLVNVSVDGPLTQEVATNLVQYVQDVESNHAK